jgi:hypothetical protein
MALAQKKKSPTRVLKLQFARDVVEALAGLLPAGRREASDLRGRSTAVDVFVTRERRGGKSVPCGVRVILGRAEFVLDDGADEFSRIHLAGVPTFDEHGNVQISVVHRRIDGGRRGCSLWLAHDLSMVAVDDEVCTLK